MTTTSNTPQGAQSQISAPTSAQVRGERVTMATIEIPTHAAASLGSGYMIPHPTDGSNGFSDMHKAAEEMAGRPVWTHEFARADSLRAEFEGKAPRPTFADVMAKVPQEKAIIMVVGAGEP